MSCPVRNWLPAGTPLVNPHTSVGASKIDNANAVSATVEDPLRPGAFAGTSNGNIAAGSDAVCPVRNGNTAAGSDAVCPVRGKAGGPPALPTASSSSSYSSCPIRGKEGAAAAADTAAAGYKSSKVGSLFTPHHHPLLHPYRYYCPRSHSHIHTHSHTHTHTHTHTQVYNVYSQEINANNNMPTNPRQEPMRYLHTSFI